MSVNGLGPGDGALAKEVAFNRENITLDQCTEYLYRVLEQAYMVNGNSFHAYQKISNCAPLENGMKPSKTAEHPPTTMPQRIFDLTQSIESQLRCIDGYVGDIHGHLGTTDVHSH